MEPKQVLAMEGPFLHAKIFPVSDDVIITLESCMGQRSLKKYRITCGTFKCISSTDVSREEYGYAASSGANKNLLILNWKLKAREKGERPTVPVVHHAFFHKPKLLTK